MKYCGAFADVLSFICNELLQLEEKFYTCLGKMAFLLFY